MRRPRVPGTVDKNSNRLLPQGRRPAIPNSTEGITFDLPLNASGANMLPTTISYGDGYQMNLAWMYRGQDASASGFPDALNNAPTLAYTSGGVESTFNADAPFLDDKAVELNTSTFAGGVNESTHQLDSDFVYFCAFSPGNSAAAYVSNNGGTSGTTAQGWLVRGVGTTQLWFNVSDGTDRCRTAHSPTGLSDNAWQIMVVCGDIDETTVFQSLRTGINLDIRGAIDTALGNLTDVINTGAKLILHGSNTSVGFVGMYKGTNIFPGGAGNIVVMDSIIQELTYRIMGLYANGQGTHTPSTASRSSATYLPIVNSDGYERWHYIGADWPRVGSVLAADGITTVKGFLSEATRTQNLTETETFEGGNWTTNLASIADGYESTVTPPVAGANVALLYVENGTGEHHVIQTITSTPVACGSLYVKKHPDSPNSRISLDVRNAATRGVVINFDTNEVAVAGSPSDYGGHPVGNGWWRIWVGDNPSDQFKVSTFNSTTVYTESGGHQPVAYLCAPMVSTTGVAPPTSYIPNTASSGTVSRSADVLEYTMDDGNCQSPEDAITVDWSSTTIDFNAAAIHTAWTLSDGGSGSDYLSGRIESTDAMAVFGTSTESGAASYILSADVADGYEHSFRFGSIATSATLTDIGASETASNTNTLPNDLDRLNVSANRVDGESLNGLLSNFRIYRKGKGV